MRHVSRPEKNAAKSGGLLSPFEHHKTPPRENGKNLLHGMAGRQKFPPPHRLGEEEQTATASQNILPLEKARREAAAQRRPPERETPFFFRETPGRRV